MKPRPNQQFLALQGDRLLGRSSLPDVPVKAGLKAAPKAPPAFGAADLVCIGVDFATPGTDTVAVYAQLSPRVAMLLSLLRAYQDLAPDEIIARGICLVAEQIGIASLAKEIAPADGRRHGNSHGKSDHG